MDGEPLETAVPASLVEAWGDQVDTRDYLRDDPSFGVVGSRLAVFATSLEDRADGRYRPIYETEADLSILRAASRNLVLMTGVRTCALDALQNYTLGTGFTFEALPENDTMRQAIQLAAVVQGVIDRFVDENDFCGVIDREIDRRSREDGEAFVAFDDDEIRQGKLLVEFIEPDQVLEPDNVSDLEDEYTGNEFVSCWKFGVHTPQGKTWKPLGYAVRCPNYEDGSYYPANRLEHIKRNVTRNAKRGVSDFLEIVADLVREAKLCSNMTQGAALQSAIAWIMQGAAGQTQTQLQGVGGAERAQLTRPSVFAGVGTTTRSAANYAAGSILKIGAGQQYLPGPMGAERNAGFELVGQYALRRIGVRWNMPEYMISGDAGSTNYAASLVAESPFVKAREADQQFYKRHFLSLLWKAIRIHVESGRFARYGIGRSQYDDLMKLIRIDAECPTVASRDPKVAVDSDKVLVDGGVMSERTWASRNGLDYDKEQKLGALKAPPPPSPFGVPGQVPGQPPVPGQNPPQAGQKPGEKPAAKSAAAKQSGTVDEFGDSYVDEFGDPRRLGESFEGHAGRPGEVGGSAPLGEGGDAPEHHEATKEIKQAVTVKDIATAPKRFNRGDFNGAVFAAGRSSHERGIPMFVYPSQAGHQVTHERPDLAPGGQYMQVVYQAGHLLGKQFKVGARTAIAAAKAVASIPDAIASTVNAAADKVIQTRQANDPFNLTPEQRRNVKESTLTAAVTTALESVDTTEEAKAILKQLSESYP